MKRFRIEIFQRDLSFRSFAEVADPDVTTDFLCLTESTVECVGEVVCVRGDFVQLRENGVVYFQGVIQDHDYNGKTTEIQLVPLASVLNTEVFADVTLLRSQSIETWMSNLLSGYFNGSDSEQNLPGFTISAESTTSGAYTATDSGAYNLYDLSVSFFKVYGVILNISFDPKTMKFVFTMKQVNQYPLKLDLSISDVTEYAIEASMSDDRPNKMIVRNQDNSSESLTYYWHPTEFSGTIDTDGSKNRVVPVVTHCDVVMVDEGQTFAAAAYAAAENSLYQTRYDDLITVVIKKDSKVISIGEIGSLYTLYDKGNVYNTMLTGIHEENGRYVELTFGYVRKRLTQILKMRK